MQSRWRRLLGRLRRFERHELHKLRHWLSETRNLVHLSILLVVPVVIGLVTLLTNAVSALSFLLFPPLASGAYTLFANPEGEYASPVRFVGGLTSGAVCGYVAVLVVGATGAAPAAGNISALGAALSVFLTGLTTWGLDVEEPAAFATALLTLVVSAQIEAPGVYVLSIAVSSTLVSVAFLGWRKFIYEQRGEYLYETTSGDDHVLVPMRGDRAAETAMLGARLAAAHSAGKVVLLDVVADEQQARAERSLLQEHDEVRLLDSGPPGRPSLDAAGRDPLDTLGDTAASGAVSDLERQASHIETRVGVPCEVVVAAAGEAPVARTVLETARRANCDLVATPYESDRGTVSGFVRDLFGGEVDVVVHRGHEDRTEWKRILVPVRSPSGVAHAMVDFALRLAGRTGEVSVATCTSDEKRRQAEAMLADLVETFEGTIETRVSTAGIESFLSDHAGEYDLVMLGASQNRSAASRFVSPPTFERIDNDAIDADVAIVDRY